MNLAIDDVAECQQSVCLSDVQSVPDAVPGGEEVAPVEPVERGHYPAPLAADGGHHLRHVFGHRRSVGRHTNLPGLGHTHAVRWRRSSHRLRLLSVRCVHSFIHSFIGHVDVDEIMHSNRSIIGCLRRFLGLNTVIAYQRAKVSAFKIVDHRTANTGEDTEDTVSLPIVGGAAGEKGKGKEKSIQNSALPSTSRDEAASCSNY